MGNNKGSHSKCVNYISKTITPSCYYYTYLFVFCWCTYVPSKERRLLGLGDRQTQRNIIFCREQSNASKSSNES